MKKNTSDKNDGNGGADSVNRKAITKIKDNIGEIKRSPRIETN
jgi:hypothetical protein